MPVRTPVSVPPSARDVEIPRRPGPGALSPFSCTQDTWRSCVPTRPFRTGADRDGPADDYRRIVFAYHLLNENSPALCMEILSDLPSADTLEVAEKPITIAAIILGGTAAYYKFLRGRVYHARMDIAMSSAWLMLAERERERRP